MVASLCVILPDCNPFYNLLPNPPSFCKYLIFYKNKNKSIPKSDGTRFMKYWYAACIDQYWSRLLRTTEEIAWKQGHAISLLYVLKLQKIHTLFITSRSPDVCGSHFFAISVLLVKNQLKDLITNVLLIVFTMAILM